MATGGRTPKLQDPGIRKALLNGIRLGMSYEKAAIFAGITYQTFKTWMDKGKVANKGQYREFYDELKKADAEGEAACIQKIQKAAQDGTWQAAAWILERRHPEDWGRKDKVDTTITHKEPLVIKGPDDGNKPN
jgi:predicted transcriptional regulator